MHNLPLSFNFPAIISKIINYMSKYYKEILQIENKSIDIHSYADDLGYPTAQ